MVSCDVNATEKKNIEDKAGGQGKAWEREVQLRVD